MQRQQRHQQPRQVDHAGFTSGPTWRLQNTASPTDAQGARRSKKLCHHAHTTRRAGRGSNRLRWPTNRPDNAWRKQPPEELQKQHPLGPKRRCNQCNQIFQHQNRNRDTRNMLQQDQRPQPEAAAAAAVDYLDYNFAQSERSGRSAQQLGSQKPRAGGNHRNLNHHLRNHNSHRCEGRNALQR